MARRCAIPCRARQRGAMSVTMLLLMVGLLTMLGLVEVGYLYWAKRDAQKTADLSAIAGAQRLDLCSAGLGDNTAARRNALVENRFGGQVDIQCGSWKPIHPAADHFLSGASTQHAMNAVKVTARRSVVPFFGHNSAMPTVSAQAVAKRSAPSAAFSVGAQLLRVNGRTPLGNTLKLVGVDLDQTTLLGYDGLAQARITPGGLLQALGIPVDANISVGDFNALLAAHRVSLGRLLDATATVLAQSGVAAVDLSALRSALATRLDLDQLAIKLGSDTAGGGLFAQVVAPEGTAASALETQLNALDLITTSISIANGGRGVAVNNLTLLGLVQAQAAVIEPPSIGIGGAHQGGVGITHNGARAYNAQVRVFVDIDTNNLPLAGGLLSLLGTRLKVPLHVDVSNAYADLKSLQCGARPRTATFDVTSSVLRTCIGKVADADRFTRRDVCDASLGKEQLLTLLGAPLINDKLQLAALSGTQRVTVPENETRSTDPNALPIGTSLMTLTNELMKLLANMINPGIAGARTDDTALQFAGQFLDATRQASGRYDVDQAVKVLRGDVRVANLNPIGDWSLKDQPSALNVFADVTQGRNGGLLGGLLSLLLGDLTAKSCSGLLTQLVDYNGCVKRNLASFLQTRPGGIGDPNAGSVVATPGATLNCSGVLCAVLKVALEPLKGLLNEVGRLLSITLANVLGLELGRTDVHVQSISCSGAQLVY